MSYTTELKNELFETKPEKNIKVLTAGIILAGGHFYFKSDQIDFEIVSENSTFIRYFYQLMQEHFKIKGEFNHREKTGFHKHKIYTLKYQNMESFLNKIGCISKLGNFYYSPILNDILFKKLPKQRAFLKGVFIGCGSILNPRSNYHLELDPYSGTVTEVCYELLKALGVKSIKGNHNKKNVLYIKEAKSLGDFLALIEANKKFFEFEDLMIVKEMRGNINRKINFETANINKTAQAASKQISSIVYLQDNNHFNQLSKELKEAAELRVAHPTISISKLVDKADFPVSRSSLHRRLSKIVEIAQSYEK